MRILRTERKKMTEAEKRANSKYKKDKVIRTQLDFYPTDQDILDHLATKPSKQRYIKDLIRADMKKSNCPD